MPRKPAKRPRPVPVKAEVYSVLTIGVPAGKAGATATERAVEQLRRNGYGAGVLAGPIGPEATVAIREVINSTAAAVKAELAPKQASNPTEGDQQQ
jgi:hypothetical protein